MQKETDIKGANQDAGDIEDYLEKRKQMDTLFKEKFSKRVTVMFTDLKGSTTIAEREGDLSSRLLIKQHNEIVFPLIAKNKGVLVKTMGDGTLSYFENAQDAVRAAVKILGACDAFNVKEKPKTPILMRVGCHTGDCIVEKNDLFGDVVNTAARFETAANPGEVYFSEETFKALSDKSEIYCRYISTVTLKGKSEPFRVYKAFWNKDEIEADIKGKKQGIQSVEEAPKKRIPAAVKILLIILIPVIIVIALIQGNKLFSGAQKTEEKRSITHSVDVSPRQP